VVLLIAVAFLYYLHFKKSEPTTEKMGTPAIAPVKYSGNGMIAYVNSDSLFDNYEFYKSKKSEIDADRARIKNQLKSQSEKLQSDFEAYQKQAMSMTDQQRAEKENELGMRQQQMMHDKDELLSKLDEKREKAMDELYSKLEDYLKKHNTGKNYSYILAYAKGGGILFANDSLDITNEVVSGLNKDFMGDGVKK
jgi:outer membrane protein